MSIDSATLAILLDGGKSIEDAIGVARACESGSDRSLIYKLIDDLEDLGSTSSVIAIAVCALADQINEGNQSRRRIVYADTHTGAKDSNRSRRGLSNIEWRQLRAQIFERDDYVCQYCGTDEDLTCDHVMPLVRGGTNDPDNLVAACRSCNSSKGDKLLDHWRGRPQ